MTALIAAVSTFMVTYAPIISAVSTVVGLVSAVSSAGAKVQAGESRAFAYEAQAEQTMMQSETDKMNARSEATEWRKQGTASLRRMRAVIAATKATAAAGNLQPLSGSTGALIDESLAAGIDDYFYTAHNAIIALEGANVAEGAARYQRDIYRRAAESASTGGYIGAGASILEGGFRAFESGAFRPAPTPTPTPTPTPI
jgi:hypothetical protein